MHMHNILLNALFHHFGENTCINDIYDLNPTGD
nr:MAG TPA: hypothetical protein [Caudoviricetes sp.]